MAERQRRNEPKFAVLFEPARECGYFATCPSLPRLVTEGDMFGEARRMARDAIRDSVESLRKDSEKFRPLLTEFVQEATRGARAGSDATRG